MESPYFSRNWSDDDEKYLEFAIKNCKLACIKAIDMPTYEISVACVSWLKSLRQRSVWAPSLNHVLMLRYAIDVLHQHEPTEDLGYLEDLLDQLRLILFRL